MLSIPIRRRGPPVSYTPPPKPEPKPEIPSDLLREWEILHFFGTELMYEGCLEEKQLLEAYADWELQPWAKEFGKMPLSTILSYREGIYHNSKEKLWSCDPDKLGYYRKVWQRF
jgi:hypothetical protein